MTYFLFAGAEKGATMIRVGITLPSSLDDIPGLAHNCSVDSEQSLAVSEVQYSHCPGRLCRSLSELLLDL